MYKLEGLLIHKSRSENLETSRGACDVVRLTLKDGRGEIGIVSVWGDQAALPIIREARVRKDVLVISGVQCDVEQGFGSTRM